MASQVGYTSDLGLHTVLITILPNCNCDVLVSDKALS